MQVGHLTIPEPDPDEYHELAAFYSGYAFYEVYRKTVLAACRELVRAGAGVSGQRISEARIDDLARQRPEYLEFLTKHLQGRMRWEQAFLAQGGMR